MKQKVMTAFFAACFCLSAMGAESVYLYTGQPESLVGQYFNVRKITFGDGVMTLSVTGEEEAQEIALDSFDYFTFTAQTITTSEDLLSMNGTVVLTDGHNLQVTADQTIDRVEIFSADGHGLLSATPAVERFIHTVADYPAGLYVVKITLGDKQEFHKIIKK